ncbi:MAG: hypothetical protein HYY09_02775, partial [Firmicutes bacterium]|nr:hypothetical protein [Bacillota bacterium]
MPEKKDESARPNGGPRPTDPLLSPGARLRALMAGDDPVVAPGAYDGLSARLIEAAGFPALCMGGYAV